MAIKTKIEWTDATWNPIRGCSKISPGCQNCYAMHVAARFNGAGQPYEGLAKRDPINWTGEVRLIDSHLDDPLRWKAPRRIFVNSMSDLFHEDVTRETIAHIFGIMAYCRRHTFQVLTKRAERMHDVVNSLTLDECLNAAGLAPDFDPRWPLENVWLGVSVEDQKRADERIPWLLKTPAAVRFISAEPLLGSLDFKFTMGPAGSGATLLGDCGYYCGEDVGHVDHRGIDWVIVGGESGPGARPMHPDWARSLRDQCISSRVPFFFKQWGEWHPESSANHYNATGKLAYGKVEGLSMLRDGSICLRDSADNPAGGHVFKDDFACARFDRYCNAKTDEWAEKINPGYQWMQRIGRMKAGRMLDGREWNQFPKLEVNYAPDYAQAGGR